MPQQHRSGGTLPVAYIVSEELVRVSSLLPSNKNRSLLVHSLVNAFGLQSLAQAPNGQKRIKFLRPRKATSKELLSYHTRNYLDYALNPSNDHDDLSQVVEFGLEDDCPPFRGMHEYIPLIAGATLTAVDAIKDNSCDVAVCWDGGRHHAQKSHASGFCYVADCVLVILALRRIPPSPSSVPPRRSRVMYLDLDLHFSDAVSHAFHNPSSTAASQVLTLSVHHAAPGFFPVSSLSAFPNPDDASFDPFTLSLPLQRGASCRTFARVWPVIERMKDTFQPDFIVVQCGVDGLAGDPMATWNWSIGGGPGSLGWCIDRIAQNWSGKKLLLGGGGYNSPNAARAWAFLTSVVAGRPLPLDTEIPDHRAFPLYQPSFTLDVPAGNMQDQNSDEYLQHLEDIFGRVQTMLQRRLSGESPS